MATPMLDDIELKAAQLIRQEVEQGFRRQRIAGLDGTLHEHVGRRSHRVLVAGLLVGEKADDDLAALQKKAAAGEQVTFTADIATALDIDKMVIERFAAEQCVGPSGQTAYALMLSESPPLPPPAEVSAFGGLDDFGMGDLGFDTDALEGTLSDIADQAESVMAAADSAMSAIEQLQKLTDLGSLGSVGSPAQPVVEALGVVDRLAPLVQSISEASSKLVQ
jgi:hypothetical protein